ncbi:MAG: PAS domain-containing protein [Stellaceae bacterium]
MVGGLNPFRLLRDTHERLETVLQTALVGLWEADLTTGALTVSPTCKANFGLPRRPRSRTRRMFAAMHPDDRLLFQEARRRAMARQAPYEVEYRNFCPDGTQHWIPTRTTIIRDRDGTPIRIVGLSAATSSITANCRM